jgi:HlyD family secretion protein
LGILVGALGCLTVAVAAARGYLPKSLMGASGPALKIVPVSRSSVSVTVSATGSFESSQNRDVASEVEGQATILFLKPQGTPVVEGDLVCELDSSTLRDQLTNQIIAVRQAESSLLNATKTRVVAELALNEYLGGTFPQSLQDAKATLSVAQTNLTSAQNRYDWSSRMLKRNLVPLATNQSDENALISSQISVRLALSRIQVLEGFTRQKKVTELQAALDKATVEERTSQDTLNLEKSKQEKLERMISKCKLFAPKAGIVVYANEETKPGRQAPVIEEGQLARERQKIFSIPDVSKMRVNTKIHESEIARVEPGQTVRVDVLGDTLPGTVTMVRAIPEPPQREVTDRYYTAFVSVPNPPAALRPGMTAKIEILVSQTDNVLTVPVQAVLPIRDKSFVFVMTAGVPTMREVHLGTSNSTTIEVKDGLNEGDRVALTPISLMTEQAIRDAFGGASRHKRSDEWNEPPAQAKSESATSPTEAVL